MSLLSIEFGIFAALCLLLYYVLPLKVRWAVLLAASLMFYASYGLKQLAVMLMTGAVAYAAAMIMERIYNVDTSSAAAAAAQRKIARYVLVISICLILAELLLVKSRHDILGPALWYLKSGQIDASIIIVPLGLSYYTFSIIGYLADVYWKKDKAEHNPLKFILYMCYFPQIIEGPIPRHKKLAAQLNAGNRFDYQSFCFGLQRVVWGAFKKLVIADRLSVAVSTISGSYTSYSGEYFVLYVIMAAVMLYTDFSGCIDMVIGISECFGIKLDENFRQPFASRSAAEFWRRWHITLGAWFKDYVFMPLAVNPKLIALSKALRGVFGAKFAKSMMTVIPLAVVWLLTGLWHGTGIDYIIWGCYWGFLIIISSVFAQQFKKLNQLLHIDVNAAWWKYFQQFRTFVIFCGSRLLTAPGDIHISWYMFKSMLRDYNPWILADKSLYNLGLDRADVWLVIVAIAILGAVGHLHEKGVHIRESIASCPLIIRWGIYYLAIFAVIIFGYYGPGYDAGAFIYMQF